MTAPEDRPDGEAGEFLADADEGMIVEPRTVRFARGWVAAGDRLAAAEARLEAVKADVSHFVNPVIGWLRLDRHNGDAPTGEQIDAMVERLRSAVAALSVAPQPQPAKSFCVTCGNLHPTEAHAQCAANEARGLHADGVDPMECEHGYTKPHDYEIAGQRGPVDGWHCHGAVS